MKKRWNMHLKFPFAERNNLEYKRMYNKVMKSSHYPRSCSICGKKLDKAKTFHKLCPSCYQFIKEMRELEQPKRKESLDLWEI